MRSSSRRSAAARRLALAGVLFLFASAARADTIIKLGLGGDTSADLEYSGGVLSTVDDGDGATTGNQNTDVDFLGFLSFLSDIASGASYTLDGVSASGAATVFGGVLVVQSLSGGTLSLYDASNTLLLSASLAGSILTGPPGAPATGAVFSTTFATLLPGGTLDSFIAPGSIAFSISMTDINGGAGLSVSGGGTVLDAFTSDATQSIAADAPEPATGLLLGLAAAGLAARRRYSSATRKCST